MQEHIPYGSRVFIRHRRLENSPATMQNYPAKFRSFPERALLFHNNSPVTLHYSRATTILNEIPDGSEYKAKISLTFN